MKLLSTSLAALALSGSLFAAQQPATAPQVSVQPAAPDKDKVSYSLGANLGNSLKMQGAEVNVDEFAKGLKDALAGQTKMDEKEVRQTLMSWQQEIRNKRMEKMRVDAEKNKKAGEEWLAANAKKPGVKTLPSGLQYKVLVSGKGPQPKNTDSVSAHYKGTLTDGTQFDSSYERGRPFVTPVTGVIAGWQEALTNMHVGDKWELYVPGNLAYGERGSPPKIGPNATLVFEMELLGIENSNVNSKPGAPSATSQPIKIEPAPPRREPVTK
jgi:FKBP-type peptidyl-prolyl cis-trans isomerase